MTQLRLHGPSPCVRLAGKPSCSASITSRQRKCRSCRRVSAAGGSGAGQEVVSATTELLQAIDSTKRGLDTSNKTLQRIQSAIKLLENSPSSGGSLSAVWRLLWTTEKETLFILKNAGWFGTKAGEVYQIIDADQGYLQNVITFPPKGAFVVDSSIQMAGGNRVDFQFTGATLQLPDRAFQVPPFGKGWFENVYMDDDIRVSKDIRGDILVTVRDGAPCRFSDMQ